MNPHQEYLDRLASYLEPHLSTEQRTSRLDEIRTHLEMDQADREADGTDPATAARLARRALGSPQILARQMIRQAKGYDSASPWRLAAKCGIVLFLALVIPYGMLGSSLFFRFGWTETVVHWVPFLALCYFGFVVVKTQRWLVKPMVLWSAACVLGVVSVNVIQALHLPPASAESLALMDRDLKALQAEQDVVDAWRSGSPPKDRAPVLVTAANQASYYVPMIPFGFTRFSPGFSVERGDAAKSLNLWRANGEAYARSVNERIEDQRTLIADSRRERRFDGVAAFRLTRILLYGTAEMTAILGFTNWLMLVVSQAVYRRKTRRDPLLA